jgi:uncharacterized damage-inducible protein DinB
MDGSLGAEVLQIVRARLVDEYPRQVRACLHTLSEDDVWWRPNEQANAVGNLILHLAGSNRFYIEHVIGGVAYNRDRDAEFAERGPMPKGAVDAMWADVERRVIRVFDGLTPERLAETTDRSGRTSSFARILLHVTHHNATHVGQIIWATKLRRPGVLQELSRTPTPASGP